jgi:predicted transcriptional regulator
MNQIAEEIKAVMDDEELMHHGMPRRSGRYPYGSGEDPYQGCRDFLGRVKEMKANGMSERDIAEAMGLVNEKGEPSSTLLRREMTIAKDEVRIYQVQTAKRLKEKEGMGATEIGRQMGLPESTVRSLLDAGKEAKMYQSRETADFIRDMIEKKGMIDVGTGVEKELGISKEMLEVAITRLQDEGYPVYKGGIPQATNPGQQTNQRVICPKGTEHKEIYQFDKIHPLNEDN